MAAPVAALKDEPAEGEEAPRAGAAAAAADPDYSDDAVEEHLSDGSPGAAEYELDSEDDERDSEGPGHS